MALFFYQFTPLYGHNRKCSTADSKFGPRSLKSRTKSSKIEKMFYSVTFSKAVWPQITSKSQKSTFCPYPRSGAVIEQMMRSTAFVKITAVYGQIAENWEFVRK